MAVIEFKKLRGHNIDIMAGGTGHHSYTDVRDTVQKYWPQFVADLANTRSGNASDQNGNIIAPIDLSLDQALRDYFGIDQATFMNQIGVYSQSQSLGQVADSFGMKNLNLTTVEQLMIDHTSFNTPMTSKDIAADFRFIIPEIIIAAIRLGYETGGNHLNWIATTQQMDDEKVVMPQILRSDSMPYKIGEGAKIPVGKVKFGKKDASVFKIGTGLGLTDELIRRSKIDLMAQFLQDVGIDIAIGEDTYAMDVLVNGEQANGSESAPVIGTINGTSIAWKDIKRVTSRLKWLRMAPDRIISEEDEAIDLTGLPRFEGFATGTENPLATLRSIVGVPDVLDNDLQVLPTDQTMILSSNRCMAKLKYGGFLVERERDITTQEEIVVVSNWTGFAIIKRDGRVLLDKSLTWVKDSATDFPAYMNIRKRIAEAFRNQNSQ